MLPAKNSQKWGRKPPKQQCPRPGARALGIQADDSTQIARLIKAGFPFSLLMKFQKATALSREDVSQYIAIPLRTLVRRQQEGRLQPDESDRVWRVSAIFDMAVDLFEGDAQA